MVALKYCTVSWFEEAITIDIAGRTNNPKAESTLLVFNVNKQTKTHKNYVITYRSKSYKLFLLYVILSHCLIGNIQSEELSQTSIESASHPLSLISTTAKLHLLQASKKLKYAIYYVLLLTSKFALQIQQLGSCGEQTTQRGCYFCAMTFSISKVLLCSRNLSSQH